MFLAKSPVADWQRTRQRPVLVWLIAIYVDHCLNQSQYEIVGVPAFSISPMPMPIPPRLAIVFIPSANSLGYYIASGGRVAGHLFDLSHLAQIPRTILLLSYNMLDGLQWRMNKHQYGDSFDLEL